MDYVECVNLSMQAGVLILLQCFWNYLSNTVAKRSFMTSLEFKFYIFWYIILPTIVTNLIVNVFFYDYRAIGSIATFPALQYNYRNNEILRETVPLLAYSVTGKFS